MLTIAAMYAAMITRSMVSRSKSGTEAPFAAGTGR
jgi:hypothetical protein